MPATGREGASTGGRTPGAAGADARLSAAVPPEHAVPARYRADRRAAAVPHALNGAGQAKTPTDHGHDPAQGSRTGPYSRARSAPWPAHLRSYRANRLALSPSDDGDRAARRAADAQLAARIRAVHQKSDGTYGTPRITAGLRETNGEAVNHRSPGSCGSPGSKGSGCAAGTAPPSPTWLRPRLRA
ncbi:transposase [Streptomyces sp.]|uniref:transposase n=1 Tax=Streptomyces sp. TaxID=1931 RepID=UPI0035C66ED7